MSHQIETINGRACMAYNEKETPWHTLGTNVSEYVTPEEIQKAAGLDWAVRKIPAYTKINDQDVAVGHSALIRESDNKILDIVSDDWNPVQNDQAFEFFNEFVAAGDMTMETAGSFKGGTIVWGLAKIKESFELFGGDRVDSYLLFSNFHRYGFSTDVRFTPIRVVCNNTLTLSLSTAVERMVKISHRKEFRPDNVKSMLGIASEKLAKYKDMASFLGSKKATDEDIVSYFTRIFPVTSANSKKEMSKSAKIAYESVHTQPGAEYAEGSWWSCYNAVTHYTDHIHGRNADNRLQSSWYGTNRGLKTKALELALEYAEA